MPAEITTILQCKEYTLSRISLDIPIPGFSGFITPWLVSESGGRSILVDPGPSCGIASLTQALHSVGVHRLDLVLITHIHIDHSGGAGLLIGAFPEARVAVHPRGAPHLIDPTRLWESTVQTLGEELALSYGEITAVPEQSILDEQASPERVEIVDTPGHSQHHRSYIYRSPGGDIAFAGETGGVYLGIGYLRPATPPRFFYETTARSVEVLRERLQDTQLMLYGHCGYTACPLRMLGAALEQLRLWKAATRDLVTKNPQADVRKAVDLLVTHLLESDHRLAKLESFPAPVRQRELYFLRNSARGFILAETAQK
ncbi:MAG TPA: MBL fold metallo-hydrolase [Firmicutes bacterium]|nr:MBL fold metallo-hydrolase [Candidatus Fermentithermobacillaceae bacterium]